MRRFAIVGVVLAWVAADIKRFLERPSAPGRVFETAEAPPGAPIGDTGMDSFARPACSWVDMR